MSNEPEREQNEILRAALYACKVILVKMQEISDAPTAQWRVDGQVVGATGSAGLRTRERHGLGVKTGSYTASRMPEGVREHGASKDVSLWRHYQWRMSRAQAARDVPLLFELAKQATRDYEVYTGVRPASRDDDASAVDELLRECRGLPAVEAARRLDCSVKWVRRIRAANDLDSESGSAHADPRLATIKRMRANGATVRAIGLEVGLSAAQVSNLLNGHSNGHRPDE